MIFKREFEKFLVSKIEEYKIKNRKIYKGKIPKEKRDLVNSFPLYCLENSYKINSIDDIDEKYDEIFKK
jgi:hypothetical protein